MSEHRIPDDEVEAAIFDFDGTIRDSMPVYFIGLKATCDQPKWNLDVTEEDFYGYGGLSVTEIIKQIFLKSKTKI